MLINEEAQNDFHFSCQLQAVNDNCTQVAKHLYDAFLQFEDEVRDRKRSRTRTNLSNIYEFIHLLLLNFLMIKEEQRVALPRSKDHRYRMPCGKRTIRAVLDFLEEGYIGQEIGDRKVKKLTTVWPKDKLKKLLEHYNLKLDDVLINYKPEYEDTLRMRAIRTSPFERGELLPIPEDELTASLRSQVCQINDYISSFEISLVVPDEFEGMKHIENKYVTRNFSGDDFDLGGRLGGGEIMNMKKVKREGILLNGEPTVELDFSGFNTMSAYSFVGAEPPAGDPYDIEGYARKGIKTLLCAMLYSKGERNSLPRGIRPWFPKLTDTFKSIWSAVLNKHKRLEPLFNVNEDEVPIGFKLQRLESDVIIEVLMRCMEAGIPAYPIHDCVVTGVSNQHTVKAIMKDVYRSKVGYDIEVTLDREPMKGIESMIL